MTWEPGDFLYAYPSACDNEMFELKDDHSECACEEGEPAWVDEVARCPCNRGNDYFLCECRSSVDMERYRIPFAS